MKNKKTYRIFSIGMALMLFLTTSGLTMDMHYCQGKLKRVNLFGKAKTCTEVQSCAKQGSCHSPKGKKEKSASCANDQMETVDHKDCCKNESIELDQDLDIEILASSSIELKPLEMVFDFLGFELFETNDLNDLVLIFYEPPAMDRDLSVLGESFLL